MKGFHIAGISITFSSDMGEPVKFIQITSLLYIIVIELKLFALS